MKPGYFHNGRQPIHWIPEDGKPSAFAFKTARGGVSLRHKPTSGIGGYRAEAYYCAECKVVIAKTES
jgi:hypothetical protein